VASRIAGRDQSGPLSADDQVKLIRAEHGLIGFLFGGRDNVAGYTAAIVLILLALTVMITSVIAPQNTKSLIGDLMPWMTLMAGILVGKKL
jgi:hypothetical protein